MARFQCLTKGVCHSCFGKIIRLVSVWADKKEDINGLEGKTVLEMFRYFSCLAATSESISAFIEIISLAGMSFLSLSTSKMQMSHTSKDLFGG